MKRWHHIALGCLLWVAFAERQWAQSSACGLTVDAGPDVVACAPAGQVTLQGQLTGSVLSFEWQPAAGLSDPYVLQPQAFVSGPASWTLVATTLDLTANAIANGDFEQGNTGFTSDYNYNPSNLAFDGNYTVVSSPSIVYANFPPCVDHTTGMGQMMVVNGGSTPGDRVWCQSVGVSPNTEYVFAAWVSNINPLLGLPELQLQIDGQPVGGIFSPPATPCNWVEWTQSWTSGSATTVEVCILSQSGAPFGNDFALDDLGLFPVCTLSDVVQADVVSVQAVAPAVVFMPCAAQGGAGIVLDGSASSAGPHISYQWTTADGAIVSGAGTAQVTVNEPGTYWLTVTYDDGLTTCTAQAVSTVLLDPDQPFVLIAPPDTLTCAQPVVQLDATNASTGPNYQYQWQALSGNIASGAQTLTPLVDQPGTYALTITNTSNGCTTSASVTVLADTLHPQALIAPPDTLGCSLQSVWLDGSSSTGQALHFQWQALSGNLASSPDSSFALADQAGQYQLVVIDTLNGCADTALAEVPWAADAPQAAILPPDTLTCLSANVTLTVATPPPDTLVWTWLDGQSQPTGSGLLTLEVTTAGWYGFAVQDTASGCADTAWVEVVALQSPPALVWQPPNTRTCADTAQWLVAQVDAGVEVQWQTPGGQVAFGDSLWTDEAGVFVLVAADPATGCADTGLVFVPVDTLTPALSLGLDGPITCLDSVATLALLTDADTSWWQGPDGTTWPGDTLTTASGGLWHAWTRDTTNGCLATDTLRVHDLRQWPQVQGTGIDTLTCAEPAGWLVAVLDGQTPDVAIRWLTPDGQVLATDIDSLPVDSAGTYLVEAVHLPSGCSTRDTLVVGLDTLPPHLGLAPPDTLTCLVSGTVLQASASAGAQVQWFDAAGVLLQEDDEVFVTAPGTYTAQAVDTANGCMAVGLVEVVAVRDTPQVSLAPLDTLDCLVQSVPLQVHGSWPATTAFWLLSPHDTLGPVGPDALLAVEAGWHLLVARDTFSGCEAMDSAQVIIDTLPPQLVLQWPSRLTCSAPQAALSWSGQADTLHLTGPQGAAFAISAGDTAWLTHGGWWQLSATGSNGCVFDTTLLVEVDSLPPEVAPTFDQSLTCAHPEASLQASALPEASVHYRWLAPTGAVLEGWQVTAAAGGLYEVVAEDTLSGCLATDTLHLPAMLDPPVVEVQPVDTLAPSCVPDTVWLEAVPLQSGLVFQWLGPPNAMVGATTAPVVGVVGAGSYALVVTDTSTGCTWDTTLVVVQHTSGLQVALFGESQLDCTHPQVALVAAHDGGGMLSWHSPDGHFAGITADTAVVDSPGTYIARVTDAFGCSASDTLVVAASFEAPQLSLPDSVARTCAPPEAMLVAVVAGADSVSLSWTHDGLPLPASGDTLVATAAGTYVLAAANAANGCVAYDTAVVWLDTVAPVVDAGQGATLTCAQPFAHLQGSVAGPAGAFELFWLSPNGDTLPPLDSFDLWATRAGPWTLVATDLLNGCTGSDTVLVVADTLPPQIALLPFGKITCADPAVTLVLETTTPGLQVTWRAPDGTLWSGSSLTTSAGGDWTVVATDAATGCTDSLHFAVEVDTLRPQVDAGPDLVLDCLDGQASAEPFIHHPRAVEVQWTGPPGGLVTSPSQPLAVFAEAGTYVLSVRDTANGCLATDSLEVRLLAPGTVYFQLQQPDCLDTTGTLRIDSVAGGMSPWAFSVDGRPFEQGSWFGGLGPGSHTLTVEDAAGCRLDTAFAIDPVLHPVLTLIGPVRVGLGDSVVLVPQLQPPGLAVAKIHWQPDLWLSCTDCLEPVLKPETEGQFFYSVVVETAQHCTAEASVMVRVVFDAPVYVPNVFSPDGDGDNDVLVPQARAEDVVRIIEFAIYDRWGELMHLARDFPPGDEQGGWDGRVGDQEAPPAVYVWTLRALLANGKEVSLQGDVLLIR